MPKPDEDWFDTDIAAMDLSYGEKAGLQIYRNYTRSFEEHAIKQFIDAIDREVLDLGSLRRLADLIVSEDARFLPVIVCAFADETLKAVFKQTLPERIPGGIAAMLNGYGPLSDLSKRIRLAYAFNVLSPDLMEEMDRLRSARNDISHSWDVSSLDEFFTKGRLADMHRIEESLSEKDSLEEFSGELSPLVAFRIRLIWIVARLVYEAAAYNRAKEARLRPVAALYGNPAPKWLSDVAEIALAASRRAVKEHKR